MRRVGLVLTLMALLSPILASACPSGQSKGAFGWCYPNIDGSVGQAAEHIKREIIAQAGGPPLEFWLAQSRNSAIGTSLPVPFQIRQALLGYIDDDALNRAHFKTGDNGVLNLGGLSVSYGDAAAITLYDVIVFRSWDDANNPAVWAHELTHVQQFRD